MKVINNNNNNNNTNHLKDLAVFHILTCGNDNQHWGKWSHSGLHRPKHTTYHITSED